MKPSCRPRTRADRRSKTARIREDQASPLVIVGTWTTAVAFSRAACLARLRCLLQLSTTFVGGVDAETPRYKGTAGTVPDRL